MMCWSVKRKKNEYVDGKLRRNERAAIEAHLKKCLSCSLDFEQACAQRSALMSLPHAAAPASLKTNLQVMASQERQAVIETHGSYPLRIWNEWKFRVNQLMRPLTIPATGGVLSSLILFATLAFTIGTTTRAVSYEVPVKYGDHMDANLVPVELRSAVVVTLSLDGRGRILDYAVQDGADSYVGDPMRLTYNNIPLPEFRSVLARTQPISRDISISFTPIVFRP